MWQYFWMYRSELPAGVGWQVFDATHFLWLGFMALLCAALCVWYAKTQPPKRLGFKRKLAWVLMALEIGKDLYLLIIGHFDVSYLPFHMCGLALFVYLVDAYRPCDTSSQLMYCLCMPGAMAALLFPDWTVYPPLNALALQSFLVHALLMTYVLMQLCTGELVPNAKSVWKCAVFLLIITPPIYFLNKLWNVNFLFVNTPSAGSPLMILGDLLGNPGYLLGYVALVGVVWALLYLPWALAARKRSIS